MREFLVSMFREVVSPSMRFRLKDMAAWLREQLDKACLWRWEIARLRQTGGGHYTIDYIGRKSWRDLAKIHFKIDGDAVASQWPGDATNISVLVTELPIPGALRVPWYLHAIVPLGRSLEEIVSEYDKELRRFIRKHRENYHFKQALEDMDIDRADRDMLRPYAVARNGDATVQVDAEIVRKLAKKFGRLDLLIRENEVVGCHLGSTVTRAKKRYWCTDRFGYLESVFSEPKLLREANSMNTYLALEWALQNDFDYYDIGTCIGSPEDGLLQWKRRRGGEVDTMGNHGYFHVRLPRSGAARFLWHVPLFSAEHGRLTLHIGIPEGPSDEEVSNRYRELGYGGLSRIYLHSERSPGDALLGMLNQVYINRHSPPAMVVIPTS